MSPILFVNCLLSCLDDINLLKIFNEVLYLFVNYSIQECELELKSITVILD